MPLRRRRLLANAGAVIVAPSLAAQAQPVRTRYTARVDRDIEVLDPAFRTGPQDGSVIWAVFQKLIRYKPGSTAWELDAAAEITQTSDTVVSFRLKPGQTFTGGFGEMTADDVKFSFERFAVNAPDGKESPYKQDWSNLRQVEVLDRFAGRIVMDKPTAKLWRVALADGSGCIVSRAAFERLGDKARQQPVGSGPYELASFEPKRGVELRRNPAYAGPRPDFDEIAVRYVPDARTAELAFRAGEVDFTELTPSVATGFRNVVNAAVTEQPGLRFVYISLNVQKPPLDNPKVRQAIHLGLDVDQMLLAGYNGKAARANALVQPQVLGHWKDAPVIRRDVAAAKRLLQEAGVSGLRLKLTVLNQPAFQTMALVARAQLAEIGITLDVDARDGGTYWSAGKGEAGKQLDLVMMRFNGKLDPNFDTQWFRTDQIGAWNWARWSSPAFDQLDTDSSATLDEAERGRMVVRMQQLMAESAAFVWLTYDVDIFAARDWLKPAIMPTGSDWQLAQFTRT